MEESKTPRVVVRETTQNQQPAVTRVSREGAVLEVKNVRLSETARAAMNRAFSCPPRGR